MPKIDELIRERDYYRDQLNLVGRKILHLQEEQSRTSREARRSRTVATLIRSLYDSLQLRITINEVGPLFLQLLTDALHIDRAVILTRQSQQNPFITQHRLGFNNTVDFLNLDGEIKKFAFASSQSNSDAFIVNLQEFLGVPFFLWSYKENEEIALLLGNSVEDHHVHRPFEEGDQEIIGSALSVFIEIMSRKRAEQELQLAAEVFASSVEGIIITDANFLLLRVNHAFTQITGYQPEEVVGKKLYWFKESTFEKQIIKSLKERDSWKGEHWNHSKNGMAYASWLSINSVKNTQEEVTNYVGIFIDITDEKRREAENKQNLKELNTAYRRFVPQRFLEYLEKPSITDIELGNYVERSMTVLFSDIRDFTMLSESMSPTDNFRFINSYLRIMEPIITRYNGFIDKYIGDAIMALYESKADDAVQSAIAMLRVLESYNKGRKRAGYQPIKIGIGVNTGKLMLGTVGSPTRMEGTVISDSVNLAARIEGVNKIYGTSLLLGEGTYNALENPGNFALRQIDKFKAKGKSKTVTIYEVFENDSPKVKEAKLNSLNIFVEAVDFYHAGQFMEAKCLFNECIVKCQQDPVSRYYIACCNRHLNIEEVRWL